jgi:hypothetical protein
VSSKELVMARLRLAAALIAVLALTACTDTDNLTAPSGTLPGGTLPGGQSGGDTTSTPGDTTSNPIDTTGAGDPVTNGTWTSPDTTTIEPVAGVYVPSGTGTASTSGSSTALVFKTSGSGLYGVGTCGADGFWTDPAGNVFGPNNPNCLAYGSDGSLGTGGLGHCFERAGIRDCGSTPAGRRRTRSTRSASRRGRRPPRWPSPSRPRRRSSTPTTGRATG